ncbi:hypothetical protein NH340_JMT00488 [Sarcoptes scabiei]|nr:hypothetical protein NH340_JMT00488 [Sarcoptes scabiei]
MDQKQSLSSIDPHKTKRKYNRKLSKSLQKESIETLQKLTDEYYHIQTKRNENAEKRRESDLLDQKDFHFLMNEIKTKKSLLFSAYEKVTSIKNYFKSTNEDPSASETTENDLEKQRKEISTRIRLVNKEESLIRKIFHDKRLRIRLENYKKQLSMKPRNLASFRALNLICIRAAKRLNSNKLNHYRRFLKHQKSFAKWLRFVRRKNQSPKSLVNRPKKFKQIQTIESIPDDWLRYLDRR